MTKTSDSIPKLLSPPKDPLTGFITGHGLTLRKNRLKYMHDCMLKYGDFVEFQVGRRFKTFMVNHPKGIEWVMLKNAKNYNKQTPGYIKVSTLTGNGVFTDSGKRWKDARKLMQPFFSTSNIKRYASIASKASQVLKNEISSQLSQDNQLINVTPMMTEYTLRVVGECIFNEDLGVYAKEIDIELTNMINISNESLNDLTSFMTPSKKRRQASFEQSQKNLDVIINKLIKRAKDQNQQTNFNLVHALENAPFDIDDRYILDQVKTLAFAGHETSASILNWAFYFIRIHKEQKLAIQREVRDLLQQRAICYEDLEQLPKLKMFIKEVMRLRPPSWSFGRLALGEDVIFGEKVKAGDIITISPYLTHHNPKLYPDPFKFDPQRFNKENSSKRERGSYIPFGLGPRFCIGADLAMVEITMLIATVIQNFDIEQDSTPIEIDPLITLRTEGPVTLKLRLSK